MLEIKFMYHDMIINGTLFQKKFLLYFLNWCSCIIHIYKEVWKKTQKNKTDNFIYLWKLVGIFNPPTACLYSEHACGVCIPTRYVTASTCPHKQRQMMRHSQHKAQHDPDNSKHEVTAPPPDITTSWHNAGCIIQTVNAGCASKQTDE